MQTAEMETVEGHKILILEWDARPHPFKGWYTVLYCRPSNLFFSLGWRTFNNIVWDVYKPAPSPLLGKLGTLDETFRYKVKEETVGKIFHPFSSIMFVITVLKLARHNCPPIVVILSLFLSSFYFSAFTSTLSSSFIYPPILFDPSVYTIQTL